MIDSVCRRDYLRFVWCTPHLLFRRNDVVEIPQLNITNNYYEKFWHTVCERSRMFYVPAYSLSKWTKCQLLFGTIRYASCNQVIQQTTSLNERSLAYMNVPNIYNLTDSLFSNFLERAGSKLLHNLKQKCSWHDLMISILSVSDDFMRNLSTTISNDMMLDFFRGQASGDHTLVGQ